MDGAYAIIDDRSRSEISLGAYGSKAAGLAFIPEMWRPPSLYIGADLHREAMSSGANQRLQLLERRLSNQALNQSLSQLLVTSAKRFKLVEGHVLIRTSGPDEDIERRGQLVSLPSLADPGEIRSTLLTLWEKASEYGEHRPIGVLIQPMLNVVYRGHVSNERRVARRSSMWQCEYDSLDREHVYRRVPQCDAADPKNGLLVDVEAHLIERIWTVAKYYSGTKRRVHLEWIWTGHELALVQLDADRTVRGAPPASLWRSIPSPPDVSELSVLTPIRLLPVTSQKLQVQHVYNQLELSTTALYALPGEIVNHYVDSGAAEHNGRLRRELEAIVVGGAVARTDIDGTVQFMLPRTNTVTSVEVLNLFLEAVAETMATEHVDAARWRVLIHRFIPAQACAWAYSDPQTTRVRIDSTWGVPEGLAWGAHDSFEISATTGDIQQKTIRYKETYLDVDENGEWFPKRAGEPWDWKQSASDVQLAKIAQGTRAIARLEQVPTQVMWFLGVRPSSGHPDCLPWFHHPSEGMTTGITSAGKKSEIIVRYRSDLDSVRIKAISGELPHGAYIEVSPSADLIRDKDFVHSLAMVSKAHSLVIVLKGSPLSHPYYILRREGAGVVCRDLMMDVPGAKRSFHKLVRDQIPEIISSRGEDVDVITAPAYIALDLIKQKLIEEALEVRAASSTSDVVEELADVMEVVRGVASELQVSLLDVFRQAKAKRARRGGFENGRFLLNTQERPLLNRTGKVENIDGSQASDTSPLHPDYETVKEFQRVAPHMISSSKLVIPLVPPLRLGRRIIQYRLRYGGAPVVVRCTYSDSEVTIEFEHGVSGSNLGDQLELDFS